MFDPNQQQGVPGQGAPIDPFAFFNSNVEDITSFEERQQRDWSKTFFEQNPEKGDCTALVKLITNIFNPNDPTPLRVTYRLPDPDNPTQEFTFLSPNSVGQKCPVMTKWWEFHQKGQAGDVIMQQKAKQLSRKRYRACYVQIINDLQEKSNNFQFRLIRFPVEFQVEKLIQGRIAPSAGAIESQKLMGIDLKPENVFDIYSSSLLILIASKGLNGRDFSKSNFSQTSAAHGIFIPTAFDSEGNPLNWRVLTEADRPAPGKPQNPDLAPGLQWVMNELQREEINLKEQWMYKEPDEATLAKVARALHYIEFNVIPPANPIDPAQQHSQPNIAPQQTVVQPNIAPQQTAPQQTVVQPNIAPQQTYGTPQYSTPQYSQPNIAPQQTVVQPNIAPQQTAPQQTAPQQTVVQPNIAPQQTQNGGDMDLLKQLGIG